ncbi:MAG: NAD+ synthase [Thermoplasmata archaeon]|nr:NAD+ synthase [Thermoplasmata archaeon]
MIAPPKLPAHARRTIERFLRAHVEQAGASGAVVGLSGGIDSALTFRLCCDALGAPQVLGVLMPNAAYDPQLVAETRDYAEALGAATVTHEIGEVEAAYRRMFPIVHDRITVGNLTARIRMAILFTEARERRFLVVGTSNKSEILAGYFTKYGDGAADLAPLGDLYKTQLRALASELGLPAAILARPPTAGFWDGQTDEEELGIRYDDLDRILVGLEQLRSIEEIATSGGWPVKLVTAVANRVTAGRHKRRLPPIPKLSLRTVGIDWRD